MENLTSVYKLPDELVNLKQEKEYLQNLDNYFKNLLFFVNTCKKFKQRILAQEIIPINRKYLLEKLESETGLIWLEIKNILVDIAHTEEHIRQMETFVKIEREKARK